MAQEESILFIKNMVCPRCIKVVEQLSKDLAIPYKNINLGSVVLLAPIEKVVKDKFAATLNVNGFELLTDHKAKTIESIKKLIIQQVFSEDLPPKNPSLVALLKGEIPYEYSHLSKLFSSVEGITLEKYAIKQKMERVKELLIYEQLVLDEIAEMLGFSSSAYLSTLFKKEIGMTPTAFKNMRNPAELRKSRDQL
jgi:AraC-like DNA-binding protein